MSSSTNSFSIELQQSLSSAATQKRIGESKVRKGEIVFVTCQRIADVSFPRLG